MKRFGLITVAGLFLVLDLFSSYSFAQRAVAQDKQDELAVCLRFIYKLDSGYLLTNNLPLPEVKCYDKITYTHVNLNSPPEGTAPTRGVILHDNRPDHCGSGGCAVYLAVQGCPDSPGNSERCKNNWFEGIADLGDEIKTGKLDENGFHYLNVTHRGLSSEYQWDGSLHRYQNLTEQARQGKKAADEAKGRRSAAMSLGLRSGQPQAQVKAILAAHGFHNVDVPDQLQGKVTKTGPWNCASDGWKNGQWTTGCVSQKGKIKLTLIFELGRMFRNADMAALQQVRTDRLIFAQFEFKTFEFPDNTLSLVSPTLKKCSGENDEDGVCLNS